MEKYFKTIQENGGQRSDPDELYTDLFHLGEHLLQRTGEYRSKGDPWKGNPMIYINDGENYSGKMKRYILLEDTFLDQIHEAQKQPSNLLNAISYFGKKKSKEHADRCFGLLFDIDDIDEDKLVNFFYGMSTGFYPRPNYIVISKSGKGMHLYYILEKPLSLFPKIKIQLKELKYELTKMFWNPTTSNNENVQFQSFDQSFMVAGTYENMKVYKTYDRFWDIETLADYINVPFDTGELFEEAQHTLEEAKELYPEWYEKVIVNKDISRKTWTCKRDLYEWWKRKIVDPRSGASYGHRYWCTMMLVIYGVKCKVPYREVEEDAYNLIPYMNAIEPTKPFTAEDVRSALGCYDLQFATFPIDDISKLSDIRIDKNKRNYRSQEVHLKGARAIQEINDEANGTNWREGNGRKSKESVVAAWRNKHPDGKKADCIRDTGLSKPTVYKHWGS